MRFLKWTGLVSLIVMQFGCTQVPKDVEPVTGFDLSRYLGKWYEVARLDHSFEKGLTDVTATYSMRDDGGVKVLNQGVDVKTGKTNEAIGKAYFVDKDTVGRLKVSFFGPFYGGYNIAKLADDYSMALIIGPTKDYAWILARSNTPNASQCKAFYDKAQQLGIKKDQWIRIIDCDLPANLK